MVDFGIPYRSGDSIRKDFIEFFKARGHTEVPSASIAPNDDPSLLFTNAGMNQFKAIFLGDNRKGYKRVTDTQKCLRVSGKHNDLDEVGRDGYHHTFFEMLGNWSFGDYYKKEAISWAWELLTEVFKIPKERLFVTIHTSDDEAEKVWLDVTDVAADRILRFDEDNFWEMGTTGPCGPCTEIHFDTGDLKTQAATCRDQVEGVNGNNHRYIEIWNLVFIQSERLQDGGLKPLAETHVDTGSGFERLCAVMQGKESNYDTDVFQPLIAKIADLSGVKYDPGEAGTPHRVIADHIRALVFTIADGATPGNEGRGYVLRRILRRASRFAHSALKQKEPFLYKVVPTLVSTMGKVFPEIAERSQYIEQVIESEEKRFLRTLSQGLDRLDKVVGKVKKSGKEELPGEEVFLMHDTFGFPADLTRVIAEENGLGVDEVGFAKCMNEQRERARKSQKFADQLANDEDWVILDSDKESKFTGYESLTDQGKVKRYREDGDWIYVVLDRTPFYAEAGGQVGDLGELVNDDVVLRVDDTFKLYDMHIHKCSLVNGLIDAENLKEFSAKVDPEARLATRRNHSATHLLHAGLRKVLGEHVVQQGSYVGPERLRFDFTHHSGVTSAELEEVENFVNREIQNNYPVATDVMKLDEAKKSRAIGLFGEKYDDTVRVLTMGPSSRELCGGTHAEATGEIGLLRLIGESSIAAGVRRIEALTSMAALRWTQGQSQLVTALSQELKVAPERLGDRVKDVVARSKQLERDLASLEEAQLASRLEGLLSKASSQGGVVALVERLKVSDYPKERLQKVLDYLAPRLGRGVAVLTHAEDGQLAVLVAVGKEAMTDVKAGDLARQLGEVAGGRGGGRPEKARAGSKNPEREGAVLARAREVLSSTFPS